MKTTLSWLPCRRSTATYGLDLSQLDDDDDDHDKDLDDMGSGHIRTRELAYRTGHCFTEACHIIFERR